MEVWKDIPEWEGSYQVSNKGRVRSIRRKTKCLRLEGLAYVRDMPGRILKLGILKNGYKMVSLSAPGKRHRAYVHDLVLLCFTGEKPRGLECCHNDGIRGNNESSNLRYDTRSANALDRHAHGTMCARRGESATSAKLTGDIVQWIRKNVGKVSMRSMGRKFGVTHGTIGLAIRRETWAHVD